MEDDQALLYIAAGTAAERQAARRILADRYLEPLIGALAKLMPASWEREALAEHGAPAALMRLFEKIEGDSDAVSANDRGVWRWLLKAGRDAARDERRWRMRHAAPEGYEVDPPERPTAEPDPPAIAVTRDSASRLLRFVTGFDNTLDRAVLLEDTIVPLRRLLEEERNIHDDDLREYTKDHTSEALRKRRERVQSKLDAFLKREGLL
jgi:hypothetical protein